MEYKEYIRVKDGTWIIDTKHGFDRMAQRWNYSDDTMKRLLDGILTKYHSNPMRFDAAANNTEYFFYNLSLRQGMILAYRNDAKGTFEGRHFILVTAYPKGQQFPMHRGTPVVYFN